MSSTIQIQKAVADVLRSISGFPADLRVVEKRDKDVEKEIQAALARLGICLYVFPPVPTSARASQGSSVAFFDGSELVVQIVEAWPLNKTGLDCWGAMDKIVCALHWNTLFGLLPYPLELATPPVRVHQDDKVRIFDVLFNARYQVS